MLDVFVRSSIGEIYVYFLNHELLELNEFQFLIISNFSNLKNASIFISGIC